MDLSNRPPFGGNGRLMFITHRTERLTELDEIRLAIEGGCSWIQLRMKEGLNEEIAREAVSLCEREQGRHVYLCVDDDPHVALSTGAEACHLGKNDMPLDTAWEMVRKRSHLDIPFYIGATANTFEDIRKAAGMGASYIGLGPYRFTQTKKRLSPILGLEGYKEIVERCRKERIDIPIFAIGGITLDDIPALMRTGITGIAVSGAIVNAPDPAEETRRFIDEINKY